MLIPCFNESRTVATVVEAFRAQLPSADIIVYDNGSEDDSRERAAEAGATVRTERTRGKGNVVRRMFADVDADIYVLVDADDTYDAGAAPSLVRRLRAGKLDMVVAARSATSTQAFRLGHRLGNRLLTRLVSWLFRTEVQDMLSGYRMMSKRCVKSFPGVSRGFEIETELTVHALQLRMPIEELVTSYRARATGSSSKLRTFVDGGRILWRIFLMVKDERPLFFFCCWGSALAVLSLGLAVPVFVTYLETGLVPRFPTAILSASIMLLAFLSFACGLILDNVSRARCESKRLIYLGLPPPD